MSFNQKDIEKIADLARIGVSGTQISELCDQLNGIVQMIAKINSVNTEGILPLAHPFDATQSLRPDVVSEANQRELFQSIAPQVQLGLYIVPKVIDAE